MWELRRSGPECIGTREKCWVAAAAEKNKTPSPLFSYSMILVEIASRSDLSAVSMAAIPDDYTLRSPFDLRFVNSSAL